MLLESLFRSLGLGQVFFIGLLMTYAAAQSVTTTKYAPNCAVSASGSATLIPSTCTLAANCAGLKYEATEGQNSVREYLGGLVDSDSADPAVGLSP